MTNISVTVLTKDSAQHIRRVLEALRRFDEVVVFDSGSKDETLDIAKTFSNVTIATTEFDGFGAVHNRASAAAKNDWILSVDSDEVLTPGLVEEILAESLDVGVVYGFPRHTYYNDKLIKGCGWYPDVQWRLYHRKKTRFSEVQVHEGVIREGMQCKQFKAPMLHYSYAHTGDFLVKMHSYAMLFAKQHARKKKSSLCKAILHGWWAFVHCYFLRRGFLDGREGFFISYYNANVAFYKYMLLVDANEGRLTF